MYFHRRKYPLLSDCSPFSIIIAVHFPAGSLRRGDPELRAALQEARPLQAPRVHSQVEHVLHRRRRQGRARQHDADQQHRRHVQEEARQAAQEQGHRGKVIFYAMPLILVKLSLPSTSLSIHIRRPRQVWNEHVSCRNFMFVTFVSYVLTNSNRSGCNRVTYVDGQGEGARN